MNITKIELFEHYKKLGSQGQILPLIRKYFGLVPTGSSSDRLKTVWVYDSSILVGGELRRLSQIPNNEEPNFFELLKATIKETSLGKTATSDDNNPTPGNDTISQTGDLDARSDLQIMSIGANILDQYDRDGWPTFIRFDFTNTPSKPSDVYVAGIENLPYFHRLLYAPRYKSDGKIAFFYQFEMWNPHQNAANSTTSGRPTGFVIRPQGKASLNARTFTKGVFGTYQIAGNGRKWAVQGYPSSFPGMTAPNPRDYQPLVGTVSFNSTGTAEGFQQPLLLSTLIGASGRSAPPLNELVGIEAISLHTSITNLVDARIIPTAPRIIADFGMEPDPNNPAQFELFIAGFDDVPYDVMRNIQDNSRQNQNDFTEPLPRRYSASYDVDEFNLGVSRSDPRSRRFGMIHGNQRSEGSQYLIRPSTTPNAAPIGGSSHSSSIRRDKTNNGLASFATVSGANDGDINGWESLDLSGTFQRAYGALFDNRGGTDITSYRDRDNVLRGGDGILAWDQTDGGTPFMNYNDTKARPVQPVMLDRPFRSVAELGYVFRDMPWKTLDFFTANSADLGLLDVFTCGGWAYDPVNDTETPTQENTPRFVAGKFNLNTPHKPVLQAMIHGGAMRGIESNPNSNYALEKIDDAVVEAIARERSLEAPTIKFIDKGDLVRTFFATKGVTTNYPAIKTLREAPVRALADVGQTRTWNLMIDLVAQSGRATGGSAQSFLVEGEVRQWVHIAIDRFTGEVIDRSVEIVVE